MKFLKQKKIKLEVYAPVQQLVDLFPPVVMKDAYPDWYARMPKGKDSENVSHCMGLKDLYNQGLMLPLWTDYEIDFSPRGVTDIRWASDNNDTSTGAIHELHRQAPGAFPGYTNVKFNSPWWFWCSEPVQWLWSQPAWNQPDPQKFTVVPGVVEYKHQNNTHINTLWQLGRANRTEKLRAGDPMVHIIPLTDQPWELEIGVMSPEIFTKKFARWNYSFNLQYQRLRSHFQKREKQ
jgi:hypothetical protein